MQPDLSGATVSEMSVSEFATRMERYIDRNPILRNLAIYGEVSEYRIQPNGAAYFKLKDAFALVECYAFANKVRAFPAVHDGQAVVVTGYVNVRKKRSQYQLVASELRLTGVGELHAQFEALKERFRAEGLFEPGRRRPMPRFPQKVALISARGKGSEDFLKTLEARAPHMSVRFVGTRVQGEGAEIDIGEALDRASRLDVDVIVLARGGGSYEDLFPFNLEPVIRAIVRSKHPVLSAIGHEPDVHLSDFVADKHCETPSNAAQYFGALRDEAIGTIRGFDDRLSRALAKRRLEAQQRHDDAAERLADAARGRVASLVERMLRLERSLDAQTPLARLSRRAERIAGLSSRLTASARHTLVPASARHARAIAAMRGLRPNVLRSFDELERGLATRLTSADPKAPLERGYAILTANGTTLTDSASVHEGSAIRAQLRRGTLEARVERVREDG